MYFGGLIAVNTLSGNNSKQQHQTSEEKKLFDIYHVVLYENKLQKRVAILKKDLKTCFAE